MEVKTNSNTKELELQWMNTSNSYSVDDVLDAYSKGKAFGKDDFIKKELIRLVSKINKAKVLSGDFGTSLYDITDSITVYLDIVDTKNFKTLIILGANVFESKESLDMVYKRALEFTKKHNSDDFKLKFTFTYNDESLNIDSINSDYLLKCELPS